MQRWHGHLSSLTIAFIDFVLFCFWVFCHILKMDPQILYNPHQNSNYKKRCLVLKFIWNREGFGKSKLRKILKELVKLSLTHSWRWSLQWPNCLSKAFIPPHQPCHTEDWASNTTAFGRYTQTTASTHPTWKEWSYPKDTRPLDCQTTETMSSKGIDVSPPEESHSREEKSWDLDVSQRGARLLEQDCTVCW